MLMNLLNMGIQTRHQGDSIVPMPKSDRRWSLRIGEGRRDRASAIWGTAVAWISLMGWSGTAGAERVVDSGWHHLRTGDQREWTEFPVDAEGDRLTLSFEAHPGPREQTLRVRHRDVKQTWRL